MNRYQAIAMLAFTLLLGCGYGEISPAAYDVATSLYNISNRKHSDYLPKAKQQIATFRDSGDISQQEEQWLNAIIDDAEQQRWERAMKSARRMMEDQVDKRP